jgi:hypothetical protein
MNRTFNEYIAITQVLMKIGQSLDEAIAASEAPIHLQDQIREYIRGPVRIDPPDILELKPAGQLCVPLGEEAPQPYWNSLRAYLQTERRRPRNVIDQLGTNSEELVCRLRRPQSADAFQVRGLVVGHIQSGKTAMMAALIARAADQGYRMFIVLAGFMNDLRSQTQRRLDQENAGGSDDMARDAPLVVHDPGVMPWIRLTNSGLEGEFKPGTVQMDPNPQTPKLIVSKKIPRVLQKLTGWLGGSPIPLGNLPALIIDDEADQGSIDTNYGKVDQFGDPLDPTKTNQAIREILQVFPKCAYVGFTATPFANVLIDVTVEDDLYPRDFIASLPEPDGYFGTRQLFGLGMTPSDLTTELPEPPRLDAIRNIPHDQLDLLDQLSYGAECPDILTDALLAWLLSCCARLARGHEREHFTMLIHPSQRTADHDVFASVIGEEVEFLRAATARPARFPDLLSRAQSIWEDDFMRVSRSQPDVLVHKFADVWRFARSVAETIEVKVLNVTSADELDYTGTAKRYVVIGGNRLSRGLTLEGLSVSMFTRNANTYDTLLQMGRWFGFRPGYYDLTRIYVEDGMAGHFADLARVELELRGDLRKYARQPNPPTPRELAPMIRAHSSMAVTSRLKMGAGRAIRISFQNETKQTVNFPTESRAALEGNIDAARTLLRQLGRPAISVSREGMHVWKDVPAQRILDFIRSYTFGSGATEVNRANLSAYIQRQNERGELRRWDIVVPRGSPERPPFSWTEEVSSRRVERTPSSATSIGVLYSGNDFVQWKEQAGRTGDDPDIGLLIFYLIDRESGAPKQDGQPDHAYFRPAATDVLGLGLKFPGSGSNVVIDYVSQHEQ